MASDPPDYPQEMNEEFNFRYDAKGLSGSVLESFKGIDSVIQGRFVCYKRNNQKGEWKYKNLDV